MPRAEGGEEIRSLALNRRAIELANWLHVRATVNENLVDGAALDYARMRAQGPTLREAGDLLLAQAREIHTARNWINSAGHGRYCDKQLDSDRECTCGRDLALARLEDMT